MPEAAPKRPRRWLRQLTLGATLALLALALAAFLALRNLDGIARFAIHRIFPGVVAEMGSLRAVSPTQLEVRKLTLKSAKTKETLLALAGGTVTFNFGTLWRAQLDEVRLDAPNLVVSPDLGEALGVQPARAEPPSPAAPANSTNPARWAIGRLVVNDGHLAITRFGEASPSVAMRFSVDLREFGVGVTAARVAHVARLENITAEDTAKYRLLELAAVDLGFTTEELFVGRHLRSVQVGPGTLTVAQSLLDFLRPTPAASPPPPNPMPRSSAQTPQTPHHGWSVGTLDLAGLDVTIPDVPGTLGLAKFRVAATLRDLGASGTPAGDAPQAVTLTDLRVATDREPAIPLLTANVAEARFTVAGLAARELDELRLVNPALDLTPSTLESPAPANPQASPPTPAATSPATEPPPTWRIGRATSKYGTLRLRGLKDGALGLSAKFSFDLTHLGTTGDAATKAHALTLWNVQATDATEAVFFTVDLAGVRFTPQGLLAQQRVEAVTLQGGRLTVGPALQALLANDDSTPAATPVAAPAAAAEPGWSLGTLDIRRVRTRIDDPRPGLTDLAFTINTVLTDVRARGAASEVLEEMQTARFENLSLRSPLDPTTKIVALRTVTVRFTLRDLARKHLRQVELDEPTIFLNQDLFVYMERATATAAPPGARPTSATEPTEPTEPNWSVDQLEVRRGRLVLGSGGSKDVGLPLEFETTASRLALDDLADLELQAILRVRRKSYEFPDYQLSVKDVEGDLRFSYPPEKGEKNLVQKLDLAGVRWRQYRVGTSWIAATYDARGINGEFGGQAYGGYVNGGFSFFFQADSPWVGWLSGTGIDTRALTAIISPQNFSLTGPLDFEMQFDAFRKEIARVRGAFHLTQPGRLKIGKLDDLLANIPADWPALKTSSTRIALETLRDFDYTTAAGDFWFVESQGILTLDLLGPLGSRKFEVALHDGEATRAQWPQGTLGKK